MKTDKITRILILYSMLAKGNKVYKSIFSMEHEINERSFDRDIEDIRLFLSEIYSPNELVFDKAENAYYITGQTRSEIDSGEAYVLAKTLLGSKALRKDEAEGIVESLIGVVSNKEARILKSKLSNDVISYDGGKHDKAILKFIRDLSNCIFENKYIKMKYHISEQNVQEIEVYPKDIQCENSQFVLYASKTKADNPTKYLIDKIEEFEIIR